MEQDPLQPGDRVIDLAGLIGTVAVVAGAPTAAIGARLGQRPWPASVAALFGGGFAGFVVGRIVGRVFYRTDDGRVAVVRVGRQALPAAVPAGLLGGLLSAFASAGLSVWILAAPAWPTLITAACCGLIAGLVFSCAAALA